MMMFLIASMMYVLIAKVHSFVLLYDTEKNEPWESSDCIYFYSKYDATIKYCLRPGQPTLFTEIYTGCENGGKKWLFKDLLSQTISPGDALRWSSSVEIADDYAHVFYNRSTIFNEDDFLCNCTRQGTFGKHCEYELFHDTKTFHQSIYVQFDLKGDVIENQRQAAIVCYELLSCDFGLLCLDWRDICDREQHCRDGLDEENCDKLEFNECELDEYRCSNGMCIPEMYFLDGK